MCYYAGKEKTMEVLYGTCSENCAGYCHLHGTGLTVKQIRNKDCLAKNCWHLEKKEHEWWSQRERTKAKRKSRKKDFKKMIGGK